MGLNSSKFGVSNNAGLGGLFRTATRAPGDLLDSGMQWADMLVYGGVVVIGGFVLMLGYSFASGRQNLAATVSAAGEIAKQGAKFTPVGRAAAVAGAI